MMSWGASVRNNIAAARRVLLGKVPPLPFPADQFWVKIAEQPAEDLAHNGPVWALQWLSQMYEEKKEQDASKKRKAEDDILLLAMDSVRVKDIPSYLTEELFEREHVQLLMCEIDEDIKPAPHPAKEEKDMWMAPGTILDLLTGRDSQVESLNKLSGGTSFLT